MLQENHAQPDQQPTFTFDDRHWRVRGLEKQLSCARMKVNLMVTRRELSHVDTLDLYAARQRRTFIKEVAAELFVEEADIKRDLGHVLRKLEAVQSQRIRESLERQTVQAAVPVMSQAQQSDALDLLRDPKLIDRIGSDFEACGLVGEQTNRLVCYLACVSRHLPAPLAVLVQSSSGAGKTTLQDATLRFMPPEQQVRLSALTAQSLYYMGPDALKHKVLAIAEEEGLTQATYALKLLQSEGRLTIACTGKDSETGRPQTELHEAEGPVAMLMTTTSEQPDAEVVSRSITLRTNEQPAQTAAINQRQRVAYQRKPADVNCRAIEARHQNAQRLLQPLTVVIPWAEQLTFRTDRIRSRRDNAKYLALIASLTLLHQYQRKQTTRLDNGATRSCVIATLDDVELANRLAADTMAPAPDCLMPQTRRLLVLLSEYVTRCVEQEGLPRTSVRFTQRAVRESLTWNDRTLRRHLARLVELEYVLPQRTGRGNQHTYQLLYDVSAGHDATSLLGLIDVRQLRGGNAPLQGHVAPPVPGDSDK